MGIPTILNVIFTAASTIYAQREQKKLQEQAQDAAATRDVRVTGSNDSIPFLYGTSFVEVQPIFVDVSDDVTFMTESPTTTTLGNLGDVTGARNEILLLQRALSFGEVSAINFVDVDGANYNDTDYNNWFKTLVERRGGISNKTAAGVSSNRNGNSTFDDIAYASEFFRMNRGDPQYSGRPGTGYYITGRLISNITRTGTSPDFTYSISSSKTYSPNSARVLLDYILDENGANIPSSSLDLESFYNAIQVCQKIVQPDAQVQGKIFGNGIFTRNVIKHEFNGLVYSSDDHISNIEDIVDSIPGGVLLRSATGELKLSIPDEDLTNAEISVSDITQSDILDFITISSPSTNNKLNKVTLNYPNVSKDFSSDLFVLDNQTFFALDNDVTLESTVSPAGCNNAYHAEHYCDTTVVRSRRNSYEFVMRTWGVILEPGDVVRIDGAALYPTSLPVNQIDQYVRIQTLTPQRDLTINVVAQEFDILDYTWGDKTDEIIAAAPVFDFSVAAPTDIDANEITDSNTNPITGITVTWVDPDDFRVTDILVEVQHGSGPFIQIATIPVGVEELFYQPVVVQALTFRIRSFTLYNQKSVYETLNAAITPSFTGVQAITPTFTKTAIVFSEGDFTNANAKFYVLDGGAKLDFVDVSDDDSLANDQWRVTSVTSDTSITFTSVNDFTDDEIDLTVTGFTAPGAINVNFNLKDTNGDVSSLTASIDIAQAAKGDDGRDGDFTQVRYSDDETEPLPSTYPTNDEGTNITWTISSADAIWAISREVTFDADNVRTNGDFTITRISGSSGTDGIRGSGDWHYRFGVTLDPNYTDTQLDSFLAMTIPGTDFDTPIPGDRLWIFASPSETDLTVTDQQVFIYANATDKWIPQAEAIDGNLLVAGTVTADNVVAGVSITSPSISGGSIDGGTITGGVIRGTIIEAGILRSTISAFPINQNTPTSLFSSIAEKRRAFVRDGGSKPLRITASSNISVAQNSQSTTTILTEDRILNVNESIPTSVVGYVDTPEALDRNWYNIVPYRFTATYPYETLGSSDGEQYYAMRFPACTVRVRTAGSIVESFTLPAQTSSQRGDSSFTPTGSARGSSRLADFVLTHSGNYSLNRYSKRLNYDSAAARNEMKVEGRGFIDLRGSEYVEFVLGTAAGSGQGIPFGTGATNVDVNITAFNVGLESDQFSEDNFFFDPTDNSQTDQSDTPPDGVEVDVGDADNPANISIPQSALDGVTIVYDPVLNKITIGEVDGSLLVGTVDGNEVAITNINPSNILPGDMFGVNVKSGDIRLNADLTFGQFHSLNDIIDTYLDQTEGVGFSLGNDNPLIPIFAIGDFNNADPAEWVATTSYILGDRVTYSNSFYIPSEDIAGDATNTNPATDTDRWDRVDIPTNSYLLYTPDTGLVVGGTITAGAVRGGDLYNSDVPVGTESGAYLDLDDGTFVFGDANQNIQFNGSTLTVNGDIITTGNIRQAAVTIDKIAVDSFVGTSFKANYTDSSDSTPSADGNMWLGTSDTARVPDGSAWDTITHVKFYIIDDDVTDYDNILLNMHEESFIRLAEDDSNFVVLGVDAVSVRTDDYYTITIDNSSVLQSLGVYNQDAAYEVRFKVTTDSYVDGNLVVDGSLTAEKIGADEILANTVRVGSDPNNLPAIVGGIASGKGGLLKSDGDFFVGDADSSQIFFDQSEGSLSLVGNTQSGGYVSGFEDFDTATLSKDDDGVSGGWSIRSAATSTTGDAVYPSTWEGYEGKFLHINSSQYTDLDIAYRVEIEFDNINSAQFEILSLNAILVGTDRYRSVELGAALSSVGNPSLTQVDIDYTSLRFNYNNAAGWSLSEAGTAEFFTMSVGAVNGVYIDKIDGNNLVVGNRGLLFNTLTTGMANTIIGLEAGTALTTGGSNVIVGSFNADIATTCTDNVIVGTGCARTMTSARYNVIIGDRVAPSITSGDENIIIGRDAGPLVTSGDNLILIGEDAGSNVTSTIGHLCIGNNGTVQVGLNGAQAILGGSSAGVRYGYILPGSDSYTDLGSSARRYLNIYAVNGTIQTSDENEKQQITEMSQSEFKVAASISKLFKKFKWNSSVEEKGTENARWHSGLIAQQVVQAFEDEELDAFAYGMVGRDAYKMGTIPQKVKDENGIKQTVDVPSKDNLLPEDDHTDALYTYNVRYNEIMSFLAAYNDQRFASLEARLDALEA